MKQKRQRLSFAGAVAITLASLAMLAALAVLFLLIARLPGWERAIRSIPDSKDRVTAQNEVLRTFIQLAGGGLVVAGFYFTWKTIRISQEGQITDRFSKAIDHLGDNNMAVRLGGIYALVRIAYDSDKDASTVVEILSAFVREATKGSSLARPSTDVQAILKVLGSAVWSEGAVDLAGCKLRAADLRSLHFRNAILDDIDFSEANLMGSQLDGASIIGADFSNAYLKFCSLRGVNSTAANYKDASLRGAKLQGANILGANFDGASLLGASLQGAEGAVRQQFENAIVDHTTVMPTFQTVESDH